MTTPDPSSSSEGAVPPEEEVGPATTDAAAAAAAAPSRRGNNTSYMGVYQQQQQQHHHHQQQQRQHKSQPHPQSQQQRPGEVSNPTLTAAPQQNAMTISGRGASSVVDGQRQQHQRQQSSSSSSSLFQPRRQPSRGPPQVQLQLQPPSRPTRSIRRIRSKCPSEYSSSSNRNNNNGVGSRPSSIVSSYSAEAGAGAAAAAGGTTSSATHHQEAASDIIPSSSPISQMKKRPKLPSDEAAAYQIFQKRSFVVSSESSSSSPPPPQQQPPSQSQSQQELPVVDTSFGTDDTGAALSSLTSMSPPLNPKTNLFSLSSYSSSSSSTSSRSSSAVKPMDYYYISQKRTTATTSTEEEGRKSNRTITSNGNSQLLPPPPIRSSGHEGAVAAAAATVNDDDTDADRNNLTRHRPHHYQSVDTASLYRPIQPVREVMIEAGLMMTIGTDRRPPPSPPPPPVPISQHHHPPSDDESHDTSSQQSQPEKSQSSPQPRPAPQPRRTVSQIRLEQRLETIRNDLLQFDDDDDGSHPEDIEDEGGYTDCDTPGMSALEARNEDVLRNHSSSTPAVHDRKSLLDHNIHRSNSQRSKQQTHVSIDSSHCGTSESSASDEEQTAGSKSVSLSVSVSMSEEETGSKSESVSVSSSDEETGSKSVSVSVTTSASETSRKSSTSSSSSSEKTSSSSSSFSYSRVGGSDLEGVSPASSRMVYKNRRRLLHHQDDDKEQQKQQQQQQQTTSQSQNMNTNTTTRIQPMMVAVEDCIQFEPTKIQEHTSRTPQTTTTATASELQDKSSLVTEDRSLNHVPAFLSYHPSKELSARLPPPLEYQSSEPSRPPHLKLRASQQSNDVRFGGIGTDNNDDGDEDDEAMLQYPLSTRNMFAQGILSGGEVSGMNETSSYTTRPLERLDSAVTYQSLVSEITMNTYDKSPGPKMTRGPPTTADLPLKIDKRAPQYLMALEQQRLESIRDKDMTIRTTNQRSIGNKLNETINTDQGVYRRTSADLNYSTVQKSEAPSLQTTGGGGSIAKVLQPAVLVIPQPPRRTLSPVPTCTLPPDPASQNEVRSSSSQTLPVGTTTVEQIGKISGNDEESMTDDKSTATRQVQVRDSIDPGILRNINFVGLRGRSSKDEEVSKYNHKPQSSSPSSVSSVKGPFVSPTGVSRNFQAVLSTPGKETNPLCYPKGLPFVPSAKDSSNGNMKDIRNETVLSNVERVRNDSKNGMESPGVSPIRGSSHTGEHSPGYRSNQPYRSRKLRLSNMSDHTYDRRRIHKPKEIDLSDHSFKGSRESLDLSQSDPNLLFDQPTGTKGLDFGGSHSSFHEDIDLSHHYIIAESNHRDQDLEVDFSRSGHLLKALDISKHTPEQILRKQASGQRTCEATADESNNNIDLSENVDESEVSYYEENLNDMSVGDSGSFQRTCVSENTGGFYSVSGGGGGGNMSTIDESVGDSMRTSESGRCGVRSMPSVTSYSNSTNATTTTGMTAQESIPSLRTYHTIASSSSVSTSSSANKSTSATASSSESYYVTSRYRRHRQELAVSSTASTAVALAPPAPTILSDSATTDRNEQMVVHRAKNYPLEVEFVSSSVLADHDYGGLLAPTVNRYSGTYSGSLNRDWQPHGAGIFRFNMTGDLYVGEFDCGNLHGCGVLKIHVGGCVPFQELDSKTGEVVLKWTDPKCQFLKGYFFLNEYIGSDPDEDWLEEIDRVRGYRWTSARVIDELVCDVIH